MKVTRHGTSGATVATAVLGISGISQGTRLVVVISGLATETIAVTGTVHAAVVTAALRPFDLATGAVNGVSALANGSYIFRDLAFEKLTFTKSAGVDSVTISYFLVEGTN